MRATPGAVIRRPTVKPLGGFSFLLVGWTFLAAAFFLAPLRATEWVVYCKRPFGGPEAVLAYLAR